MLAHTLSCDCCCADSVTLSRCASGGVWGNAIWMPDLSTYDSGERISQYAGEDPATFYTIEKLELGATVTDYSVKRVAIRTHTAKDDRALRLRLELNATGGDFSAGLIFWPNTYERGIPFNPQSDRDGFQFRGILGDAWFRNIVKRGQQEYSADPLFPDETSDLQAASDERPLPFATVVVETSDGSRYYGCGLGILRRFNHCWQGAYGTGWGSMPRWHDHYGHALDNVGTLSADGKPGLESFASWCFPDDAPHDVTRVGFLIGLTSWWGQYAASEYVSRNLAAGSYVEEMLVDSIRLAACWTEFCHCYLRDVTKLRLDFAEAPAADVDVPLWSELSGVGFDLTRTKGTTVDEIDGPGGIGGGVGNNVYRGSTTITIAERDTIEELTIEDNGNTIPAGHHERVRFWRGPDQSSGESSDWLETDGLSAAGVQAEIQSSLSGFGSTTVAGDPLSLLTFTTPSELASCVYAEFGIFDDATETYQGLTQPRHAVTARRITSFGTPAQTHTIEAELTIGPQYTGESISEDRDQRGCSRLNLTLGGFAVYSDERPLSGGTWGVDASMEPLLLEFDSSGGGLADICARPDATPDPDVFYLGRVLDLGLECDFHPINPDTFRSRNYLRQAHVIVTETT